MRYHGTAAQAAAAAIGDELPTEKTTDAAMVAKPPGALVQEANRVSKSLSVSDGPSWQHACLHTFSECSGVAHTHEKLRDK
jgi:hypothetical protein